MLARLTAVLRAALLMAALAICSLGAGPALAVQPDEVLSDPRLEARARALSAELRCLVCQNQSIDDSDAPLARDLRLLVRERLTAGDSDAAVREFLVARYGDFVLLQPPFNPRTFLLWLLPAVALGFALWLSSTLFRRNSGKDLTTAAALTPAEEARLAEVLKRKDDAAPGE